MNTQPGEIVLTLIPSSGGNTKHRPAVVLSVLPGTYRDLLVCGISTQLHQFTRDWDEIVAGTDGDFTTSGLHQPSLIRLSFLQAVAANSCTATIGKISSERLQRLLNRLSTHFSVKTQSSDNP